MFLGNTVFLSYRGSYYPQAQALKAWLEGSGYCQYAILYPPNTICTSDELLLPFDVLELLGKLRDGHLAGFGSYADSSIFDADAFVYLASDDYWESLFTQAEVMLWRCQSAEFYPAAFDHQGHPILGQMQHIPLSGPEQDLRMMAYRTSRHTTRAPRGGTYYWGKFAKSCFLIGCPNCTEYFLVSTKAVYKALKKEFHVACPTCLNDQFYFEESDSKGHFYRKPIRIYHHIKGKPRILQIDEMMRLVDDNELPLGIGLVTLPGESLKSDMGKVIRGYAAAGVAIAGIAFVGWLFSDKDG